jgi:hypothetical protein
MAKRKRLTPPAARAKATAHPTRLEIKAHHPLRGSADDQPHLRVAGDTATRAALEELAGEVADARNTGRRMVQALACQTSAPTICRESRYRNHREDMDALATLQARCANPIEVAELDGGGFD